MKHIDYSRHHWEEGDIAFLKPDDEFSSEQRHELLAPRAQYPQGYLHPRATGHPVIILSRLSAASTHVAITPVSAYSSGPDNNYLPPWEQKCHQRKKFGDFRSFAGSALAPGKTPESALRLRDNKTMPKPKTSWVYVQSVWVVPLTVLKGFTKSRQGLLQVDRDSLVSLRRHMALANKNIGQVKRDLAALEPKPVARPDPVAAVGPVAAGTTAPSRPAVNSIAKSRQLPVAAIVTPAPSPPVVAPPAKTSWAAIACSHAGHATGPAPAPPTKKSWATISFSCAAVPKAKLISVA